MNNFIRGGDEENSTAGADGKETPESKGLSREKFEEYQKHACEREVSKLKRLITAVYHDKTYYSAKTIRTGEAQQVYGCMYTYRILKNIKMPESFSLLSCIILCG